MKKKRSRRDFLFKAGSATFGLISLLPFLLGNGYVPSLQRDNPDVGFGSLVEDPHKNMDLPEGFSYKIIARSGERMTDGFYMPGHPDGMGAFEGPDGLTIIMRNHENFPEYLQEFGPFGPTNELQGRLNQRLIYDGGREGGPALGAVTTLVYDTKAQELRRQFLTLVGTFVNCSGGVTPWNSWISCEEIFLNPSFTNAKRHGYAFEITASIGQKVVKPVPLKAMGRFVHEAVAVDPRTNIIYQTEDHLDGLVYRFLPNRPGNLEEGGRLQCLSIDSQPWMDTRNWDEQRVKQGEKLPVSWIDLEDVFVCEDGYDEQYLAGITPQGKVYRFAHNFLDESEFTGVCFSPDGCTMFVNYQDAGITFAVTGPWKTKEGVKP